MRNTELLALLPQEADRTLFKVQRWATPEEGTVLWTLIQAHGIKAYLECGTANGYTALWAASADVPVQTWDIVDRPKIWGSVSALAELKGGVTFHLRSFSEGVLKAERIGPTLYFIDGEHDWKSVIRDWEAVKGRLVPGDLVVFHDTNDSGVQALVLDLLRTYRGAMIRTRRGMGVVFA